MQSIHPTAIIDPKAELADSVSVGAFTTIGPDVRIGEGSAIGAHCVIEGVTTIGCDNRIYQFSSLGADPQDKKYKGEPTQLIIGDRNTIREFTTFNTGTSQDKGVTQIGHDNWIMAYVHVAHDCVIGDHNVIANSVQFAGHVTVGSFTLIGGMSGIHQFVRIGDFAMLGFQTRLSQDLPPFVVAAGNPAEAQNVHQEGPRRRGYLPERLANLKAMYKLLYRKGLTLAASMDEIAALKSSSDSEVEGVHSDIDKMLAFLAEAKRGIVR